MHYGMLVCAATECIASSLKLKQEVVEGFDRVGGMQAFTARSAAVLRSQTEEETVSARRELINPTVSPNAKPGRFCASCGALPEKLKNCSRCRTVWYCSEDCQRRHWPLHKGHCKLSK